jgi:hypothetical protein
MRYTHGPKRSGGRRGAGLVEAMIGLAIMATSMAGTCRVVLQAKQVSDMARSHYTAAAIAKNRIERILTTSFGTADLYAESNVRVNTSGTADAMGAYRRSTTIRAVGAGMKEVLVSVKIQNRITLAFGSEEEKVSSLTADFQQPPT